MLTFYSVNRGDFAKQARTSGARFTLSSPPPSLHHPAQGREKQPPQVEVGLLASPKLEAAKMQVTVTKHFYKNNGNENGAH